MEKGDKSHLDVAKEFSVAKSTVRLLCSRKVQLESMQLSLLLISYMDKMYLYNIMYIS